jgi:hypothetical protein
MLLHLALAAGSLLAQPAPASPEAVRVQAELQALHAELNRARRARDRAALAQVFAPEFRWVHGVGYADDRARQIESILEANSDRALPPPDFSPPNELMVFGDTAILRRPRFTAQGGRDLYSTHIFVRREGRWQILHMQGTPLLPERQWIALPEAALEAVAGRYRMASGTVTTLGREGSAIRRRTPEFPNRLLRPVEPDRYFDEIGTEYVFERGPGGEVTGFRFRFAAGGPEGRAERVR